MERTIDAATAPTEPFSRRTKAHEALAALEGAWHGLTRTWLDPAAPPEESPTDATITQLLGGRWIRIDTAGRVIGKVHAGQMIVGFHVDAGAYEIAWIDSFHTGTAMMLSVGPARDDGAISVLGSYAAGSERWGWRTVIRREAADRLVIEAFNIPPGGAEERALETRLTRR